MNITIKPEMELPKGWFPFLKKWFTSWKEKHSTPRTTHYYSLLGEEFAGRYNCCSSLEMNAVLLSFVNTYQSIRKKDTKNSLAFLQSFESGVDPVKAETHKVPGTDITYTGMTKDILSCIHFPAHFEGFHKNLFLNFRYIDHYYDLIRCLIRYNENIDEAISMYEALSSQERYDNNCLFYFLIGGFLYRKRNDTAQGDLRTAEYKYLRGSDCYKNKAACRHCLAKCNEAAIHVELQRGLATIKRLDILYPDATTAENGFKEASAAFKKALSTLRVCSFPEKNSIRSDVLFSFGYLSFVHFFRLLYKLNTCNHNHIILARKLLVKSDNLRRSSHAVSSSRVAVIDYYRKEKDSVSRMLSDYLKNHAAGEPHFIAGKLGTEQNLNIIWAYYLLLLVDANCSRFSNSTLLHNNILKHIDLIFTKKQKKGPMDCHGTDLLIVEKIRQDLYPEQQVGSHALEIISRFEKAYNSQGYTNTFQDLL